MHGVKLKITILIFHTKSYKLRRKHMLLVYQGEIQDIQFQQDYAWYVFIPH
jgi:hypothetical protein